MSRLFIPKSLKQDYDKLLATKKTTKMLSDFIPFDQITWMTRNYRDKLISISQALQQSPSAPQIDLTDECVSIIIDTDAIDYIRATSGVFNSFIALLGVENGHITFSLLGGDPMDQNRISQEYKLGAYGIETWPRRGVIGMTKDFNDVLDCR